MSPVARRMPRLSTAAPTEILNEPEPTCIEDLDGLSPAAINSYWSTVSRIMEGNIHREADDDESADEPSPPKPTGRDMTDYTAGSEFRPLDWTTVKALSPQQYLDRKAEIDSFVSRGGRGE